MSQAFIPACFYRGGSSKGVFFHEADLPKDRAVRDAVLLAALGSPDPNGRQLDGLGGGTSSLSKVSIIGPSSHPGADIDYTFAQVAVDQPIVDWEANCGNLSSAVGPFAVDEGLIKIEGGEAIVRIHQVNTKKIIIARFPVRESKAIVEGEFTIAGVSGQGARIRLDFQNPGGSIAAKLLPTGNTVDMVRAEDGQEIKFSLVDASNPVAFVLASDLGLTGTETPDEIERRPDLMQKLDNLRRKAGVLMGLGRSESEIKLASPKIATVASPQAFETIDRSRLDLDTHDIAVRMVSMERLHRAITLTGAMCAAAAVNIEGTIPWQCARRPIVGDEIRVGNPSGVVSVTAVVRRRREWSVESTGVFRTARLLMRGHVAVPKRLLENSSSSAINDRA